MIYDISPPISSELNVWPGDIPMSQEVIASFSRGDSIAISGLKSTVHLGAHADAPSHFMEGASSIGECELSNYLGPCQVIRLKCKKKQIIKPDALTTAIESERILLATGTFPNPNNWNNDFAALSPELVDYFYDKGVKLIGVDCPSVDLFDSKLLPVHKHFFKNKMAILEGLVLKDIPEGIYELIALPLRLMNFDASPVRAILRKI